MKLSISNIAWNKEDDEKMYEYISRLNFDAIEVAPTRVIEEKPYENLENAKKNANELLEKYNLKISSMQSIWYGMQEKIFESEESREKLINYTKKAIDFAYAINCKNLVFGSPKNRVMNDIKKDYKIAIDFFKKIADYARDKEVYFLVEANPTIYNTNFITTTNEAIKLVQDLDDNNIKINLDVGTIIQNHENINILRNNIKLINHIHISEPYLEIIKKRDLHKDLAEILKEYKYENYVSIEMKLVENIEEIKNVMSYVKEVFG